MIKGIHHATVSVLDLEGAIAFYAAGAGLSVERHVGAPAVTEAFAAAGQPADAVGVLLRGPNGFLEVLQFTPPEGGHPANRPVCDPGITHLCFQHQRIDELVAGFVAAGAAPHAAPVALGTGYEYCYVRDLETNVLELEGNPVAPPPPGPWLSHVSISTADVDGLAAFYGALLGRGVRATGQYGPNPLIDRITRLQGARVRAAWLDAGSVGLELLQYLDPATVAPVAERGIAELGYGCLCFEIDDLDAERARLTALGLRFAGRTASGRDGRSIFARDPDGNLLQFVEFSTTGRDLSLDSLADPAALRRADAAMAASRAQPQEATRQ